MTTTLCTSAEVKLAAGANVSTALTEANYTTFINQAEGQLCADTLVDWVSAYSGVSANYKKIIENACANYAAVQAINYDPSGYTSLNEAATMVNICLDRYDRAVTKLKEANVYKPFGASQITQ